MNSCNLWLLYTKINISRVQLFNTKVHPCLSVVLFRKINTRGSQRKGKLSTVRKKIDQNQQNYVDVETKSAGDFMKKFNSENTHLFGEIANVVKQTFSFTKKEKKTTMKLISSSDDLIYNNYSLPIQDVKSTLLSSDISSRDSIKSKNVISDSILKFPLMDRVSKEQSKELTTELNCLRQWLENICQGKNTPSVTSVLESTMPPEQVQVLERLKASMIKEMGEEGFKKYQKELLFNESSLHQTINSHFYGISEMKVEVLPANIGHWNSLKSTLPDIKDVKLLVEHVAHPFLHYKGVIDCLGKYKNHLVVVDWKTSKKPKLSLSLTYDNPLQVAAYVGALNFDPKFRYMINQGLIVIAYENGTPATAHHLSGPVLLSYWQKWLCRLKLYYEKVQCS